MMSAINPLSSTAPMEPLKCWNKESLAVFNGDEAAFVCRESLNLTVLAQTYLTIIKDSHQSQICLNEITNLTKILIDRLDALTLSKVSIFSPTYESESGSYLDVPIVNKIPDNSLCIDCDIKRLTHYLKGKTASDVYPSDSFPFFDYSAQELYSSYLNDHYYDLENRIAAFSALEGNKVIFVSPKSYFNQLRISSALRESGWKTFLIAFDPFVSDYQKDFFDDFFYTDLFSLLRLINRGVPLLLHTQGWLFRYHIPCLINAYRHPQVPQIVEMMDINSFFLPVARIEELASFMRKAWGENAVENHLLQVECEQAIMRHSDGVIFCGDEGHQQKLVPGDLLDDSPHKFLNFYSYPLEKFFAPEHVHDSENRLVFAGGIPTFTANHPPELFRDAQMVDVVKDLLEQDFDITIFNNPKISLTNNYRYLYADYLSLQEEHPHFRFSIGRLPWEMNPQLAEYDWGLMLYYFDVLIGNDHIRHIMPTKLFMYLEAGLPVLVSAELVTAARFVKKHNVGLVVEREKIKSLNEMIGSVDYPQLRRNVLNVRRWISMQNQLSQLIKLYSTAARQSRQSQEQ